MSEVVVAPPAAPEPVASPPAPSDPRRALRTARLIALVCGTLGVLFALATPFLPVVQTTATVNWPQGGSLDDIDAPLISQVPERLQISIPCAELNRLPARGGIALATAPAQGTGATVEAMFIRVADTVDVIDRNVVVASAARTDLSRCSALTVDSTIDATTATFEGLRTATGEPVQGRLDGDLRPQVVGVYSDLQGAPAPGLSFSMVVDSRYSSHPSLVKLLAMIGAVATTLLALAALARLDTSDGRGHRRFFPASWFRPTWVDAVVIGTLVLWHFVGANTSDDGYLLTMARVAGHAGYMANYFRWFGVPEAPFGWYYNVFELFSRVSDASPWIRLPALICGILCWMVISREVVPRLGHAVRSSRIALWTGGLVFLAFWLPFDNGLRSEPIVALGALLTWCSVERAIATGRLLPAAVAALIGAFTLAAAPTGLMCVAALLAGARPITRIIVRRHREVGTLPLLAPIAAAGLLVLVVVYGDQTFAGIQEANRVRRLEGPNLAWYEDFLRYYYLFVETVDGSVSRRFAFLTMVLCLLTTLLVLLRRRVPGVANGPSWRLLAVVFGGLFFLMFNPTKWTHHFGAFAGIAGSIAALTAVVVSANALRSRRNRTFFLVGLLFVLALAFSGINGYWYVSSYGVPWFDKQVTLGGYASNTVLLVLFGLAALVLGWQYLRADYATPPAAHSRRGRRIGSLAGAPLTVAAALMVAFEVRSLLKGAVAQYPAYSLARSNIEALSGKTCGLADDVLVETDPNNGRLTPIIDPANPPQNPNDPLGGGAPVGFSPDGIPDDLSADKVSVKPGMGNTVQQGVGPNVAGGESAGTGGGTGERTVNGSTAKLPFGLDPKTTPVLGSYQPSLQEPAQLTSSWYQLPPRSADAPLVVISAAGRIWSVDDTGTSTYGQSLTVDYGKKMPDGSIQVEGNYLPRDIGPAPSWRNLRVPLDELAADADVIRIVANDPNLTGDQWLAFTPPRLPKLSSLNSFIGSTQPVLLDWAVGLQFPCQRPFDHRYGVAEMPDYRILPDRPLAISSTDTWQAAEFGGPLGFTEMIASSSTVPTYLKDNWARDWGSLERYNRYYPSAKPAQIETDETTRSGFWTPGQIRAS